MMMMMMMIEILEIFVSDTDTDMFIRILHEMGFMASTSIHNNTKKKQANSTLKKSKLQRQMIKRC